MTKIDIIDQIMKDHGYEILVEHPGSEHLQYIKWIGNKDTKKAFDFLIDVYFHEGFKRIQLNYGGCGSAPITLPYFYPKEWGTKESKEIWETFWDYVKCKIVPEYGIINYDMDMERIVHGSIFDKVMDVIR